MKCRIVMAASVFVGLLILSCAGSAQEISFGKAGTAEMSGGISFSSITPVSNGKTSDATTLFSFGPEIGYFVADGFEIGFNPGMSILPGVSVATPSQGDGVTILQLFFFPGYNYHTDGGRVTPFLQVPLGYTSMTSGKITDSGFSWGVKGGIKVAAAGHFLVTVYGEYLLLSFTPESAKERSGFNFLSFGVAFGGFF